MFHGTTPTDKAERKLFTNVDSMLFNKSQFKITKDLFNGLIRAMLINVNCNNVNFSCIFRPMGFGVGDSYTQGSMVMNRPSVAPDDCKRRE